MFVGQSITRAVGATVFGSHRIRAEPDYATAKFVVASVWPQPDEAIEDCNAATRRVRDVLREHAIEDDAIMSSRVALHLAYSGYAGDRKPVGYRAAREFQVRTHDLSGIEGFLVALVGAGARELQSVTYHSSRLKELRVQARQGAIRAARAKAETYAAAADARIGRVLHIEDVNPETLRHRSHAADISVDDHTEEDAGVGSIEVAGAVMVCFAIVD